MSRICEAMELNKGFQANADRSVAVRHANAYVTLLMASGLVLAVATVSIEVVKAAALL